jgi:hypothetical protein
VQDFLRDGQVSVDIFGIVRSTGGDHGRGPIAASTRRTANAFGVGESMNFGAAQNCARGILGRSDRWARSTQPCRGDSVRVEVVIAHQKG